MFIFQYSLPPSLVKSLVQSTTALRQGRKAQALFVVGVEKGVEADRVENPPRQEELPPPGNNTM